ncbi:AAA domain-containing protein [Bordetella sp. LUAb4]|uniref:AAA domain-containing protein n=1 Tax=Bordetella sp. LUAb4 TaxID=2843195 RepID=UPI001E57F5FF|nr:AAA domain-containing protein [Bordetella sp. LUAb4]
MTVSPRELLHRLFVYIEEQLKTVDPRGFQIVKSATSNNGRLFFPKDLANLPGVQFDLQEPGDHVWLKVDRLEEIGPPAVGTGPFAQALRLDVDPNGKPPRVDDVTLQAMLQDVPEERREVAQAQLHEQAQAALAVYTAQWLAWAAAEKPRRKSISLYGDLFALRHQLQAEQTANPVEFVWGIGIAAWKLRFDAEAFDFQYPLLTQPLEIALDVDSMALEVRARATDPNCEMDALVTCGVMGAAECEKAVLAQLTEQRDAPLTPFTPSSYADMLKLAARSLDSRGSYVEVLAQGGEPPVAGEHLVVTDAWVLFTRPKSNNFLVADLKNIRTRLEEGCEIPAGPLALVTPPSDEPISYDAVNFRGLSGRGAGGKGKTQELYFPLPYNQEQVTIVQRLERAAGVTVQGPPGTGKTHTIANIICHYLASGRRVLVTSRGEPALKVLQSKIPESVRPLTVALLAGDRDGVRQFQASIEAIQHQVSQLNPQAVRDDIAGLQQSIDRAHAELVVIDRRIDEIALQQLGEIQVDGTAHRAEQLAEMVVEGAARFAWFDDALTLDACHAPPLSKDEAAELRTLRRQLGPDLVYADASIPSPDELPLAADIGQLHESLCKLKSLDEATSTGALMALRAITPEVLQAARTMLAQVEGAHAILQSLRDVDGDWPDGLRRKAAQASYATEIDALMALFDDAQALGLARAAFMKRPVDFPAEGLADTKTREAVDRAASTGKPFGLFALGAGDAKAHIAKVKVNGLDPRGTDDWSHVQAYLRLHEQVLSFESRWNPVAGELGLPRMEGGVARLRALELTTTGARQTVELARKYDQALAKAAPTVFAEALPTLGCADAAELERVRSHLLKHLTRAELAEASLALNRLQERVAGKSGPAAQVLREFIDQQLGNDEVDGARVAGRYTDIVAELRRVAGLSGVLNRVKEYAGRLEQAGAAKLARRVRTVPVEQSGDDATFPLAWREAWAWSRVRAHLEQIEARTELLDLNARRATLEGGLSQMYQDVVGKAAWLATKRNASPKVLQALAGYSTAIRRIGQGTGPNAMRYRRDAQTAMQDAADAVPCWIMSHARISESMPADIGAFDLVIVDEASQSDLWALPAIVRARKILVVGDDKQVSPDSGFRASARIDELRTRFLSEQPYGADMTPEKSLYDLAARVFAADQVMLREHFRCVPPIVAYSNRFFYKGAIQPLRIPRPSERLDPPLVDIHVPDGVRDRKECNQAEAQAIAAEIEAILADERYAGRTIGVVSLLGMEQAKHIDTLVRERLPAAELLRREFDCGDARTFQGSERDIIFLSMVADPERSHALSGNAYDQRFNVAASRARDRMYLVRSVTAEQLSERDIRRSLLEHFDKPRVDEAPGQDSLAALCESGFEREVFGMLVQQGYRVTPQVRSGAYRLDMVVEGANDARLAIECDGDAFHGPDRWADDMSRQRILERAGWTFWRCFASTWRLRKDEVFAELVERLTSMGITPQGALARLPAWVETRVWQAAQQV